MKKSGLPETGELKSPWAETASIGYALPQQELSIFLDLNRFVGNQEFFEILLLKLDPNVELAVFNKKLEEILAILESIQPQALARLYISETLESGRTPNISGSELAVIALAQFFLNILYLRRRKIDSISLSIALQAQLKSYRLQTQLKH